MLYRGCNAVRQISNGVPSWNREKGEDIRIYRKSTTLDYNISCSLDNGN